MLINAGHITTNVGIKKDFDGDFDDGFGFGRGLSSFDFC